MHFCRGFHLCLHLIRIRRCTNASPFPKKPDIPQRARAWSLLQSLKQHQAEHVRKAKEAAEALRVFFSWPGLHWPSTLSLWCAGACGWERNSCVAEASGCSQRYVLLYLYGFGMELFMLLIQVPISESHLSVVGLITVSSVIDSQKISEEFYQQMLAACEPRARDGARGKNEPRPSTRMLWCTHTYGQTDGRTDGQKDGQTDRQTPIHACIYMHTHVCEYTLKVYKQSENKHVCTP